jgi:glycosyltransferase involved in cell wall biosynthesis
MSAEQEQFQILVVDRRLASYSRNFYDCLIETYSSPPQGAIIVASSSSIPLNPWKSSELVPRVAQLIQTLPARFFWPRGTVWPTRALWKMLNSLTFTALIIREYNPYAILAFLWAKFHRHKVVISTDVGPGFRYGSQRLTITQKIVQGLANRAADGMIACTRDAERRAESIHLPSILAPHAVDSDIYKPSQNATEKSKSDRIRVIQVSGFFHWKGVDLLLNAFSLALFQDDRLELHVVGSGDSAPYLQMARQLGINDRVFFSGFVDVDELVKEYCGSDIFILTSRTDTLGVVAHEAACCGLPLLISSHAGASEVFLEEGVNGFSINPLDSEMISDRIIQLARDPKLRAKMGQASRKIGEKWCVKKNADRTSAWLKLL